MHFENTRSYKRACVFLHSGVFTLAGTQVVLPCDTSIHRHDLVRPTYIWRDGKGRPITHGRAEIEKNGALVISDSQPGDSGKYTCHVTSRGSSGIEPAGITHEPHHLLGLYKQVWLVQ